MAQGRNITLDSYKIFLSFLVIILHLYPIFEGRPFLNEITSYGITRIAVPSFFLINGYFLVGKLSDWKKLIPYLKHLSILYVVWTLIYLPYNFAYNASVEDVIYRIFFLGNFHLWYVIALIYVVVILYFIQRCIGSLKGILLLSILSFCAAYFLQENSVVFKVAFYQTGFFMGLSFVSLGYYIGKIGLVEKMKEKKAKLIVYTLSLISLVGVCIEFMGAPFIPALPQSWYYSKEIYLFCILLVPGLFLTVMSFSVYKENVSVYFSQLSTAIYLSHNLFALYFYGLGSMMLVFGAFRISMIFICTLIFSFLVIWANKKVKFLL